MSEEKEQLLSNSQQFKSNSQESLDTSLTEMIEYVAEKMEQAEYECGEGYGACSPSTLHRHPVEAEHGEFQKLATLLDNLLTERTKYLLAPVSSTLDRLLDKYFDPADTKRRTDFVESDLGEIEHKGERVMVKIKVVRGEGV